MAQFKPQLADALIACLSPIRDKYKELQENQDYVYDLMRQGAEQTKEEAEHRMQLIKTIMGLIVFTVFLIVMYLSRGKHDSHEFKKNTDWSCLHA